MRVKWTEFASASFIMNVYDMYPDANSSDFDKEFEGEVIGTNKNIWGNTYLVVVCLDNKIREVEINKTKII